MLIKQSSSQLIQTLLYGFKKKPKSAQVVDNMANNYELA